MKTIYDLRTNYAIPPKIYLGGLDNSFVCALNGIQEKTFSLVQKFNNCYEMSFTVDKYINGETISNGYDYLGEFVNLYVENLGWFIMGEPQIANDGYNESKIVKAESRESEFVNKDLTNFKINCGTTDSREMLVSGNVVTDETGVEFAKKQITFCDKGNQDLSLLHIWLKETGITGWTIGYVDNAAKTYTTYVDGAKSETTTLLKNEIGTFSVDSQTAYAFLTQDVSKYFHCVFVFDFNNLTINVYRAENVGKESGLTIGFRNIENTNNISVDENSIYTQYRVSGDNSNNSYDIDLSYVNFGSNIIENLSYFLTEKYMPVSLIVKYKAWYEDMRAAQYTYADYSRKYNLMLDKKTELENRLPLDDCSTDWSTFTTTDLQNKLSDYTAEQTYIENLFKKPDGTIDTDALQASDLAGEYNQIVNVIIPNIKIAQANKNAATSSDVKDYIEEKDWTLYGLDELNAKMQLYQAQLEVYVKNGYNVSTNSAHSAAYQAECYAKYQELSNQLNASTTGTLAYEYNSRKSEIASCESQMQSYQQQRATLAASIDKATWKKNGYDQFTTADLHILERLYRTTDYTNDNMFISSTETNAEVVDEALRLLDAAYEDLSAKSQPQYKYTTTVDNFIADVGYSEIVNNLDVGDFVSFEDYENHFVKLRLITTTHNPLTMENDITIEFSNMIQSSSKRDDIASILSLASGDSKNSITGTSNDSKSSEDDLSVRAVLNKILASTKFNEMVGAQVSAGYGDYIGESVLTKELEANMIKCVDINATNGFFQYLSSQLIAANKVVANSAVFKDLDALVGKIDKAIIGTSSTETGIVVRLTADNAAIDEAFIKQVIAQYISVNELKAGNINTDNMNITCSDGSMSIIGNTMTFKDSLGNTRIQIGRDTANNFTFVVYDATGTGVLIDSSGVKASAISDGLIVDKMVASKSIGKDKLNFYVVDANADGTVDSAKVMYNGVQLSAELSTIKTDISGNATNISAVSTKVDGVQKSITDKVWQTDINTSINSYDGTTAKAIRDRVSTTETGITGIKSTVSSVQSTLTTKADNTTVAALDTRLTKSEQDATGFKTTVEQTYATKTSLSSEIATLQNQIDGAIETWSYDPIPTLLNEPAVNWTDDATKNIHIGDLYYVSGTTENGFCYRFQLSGGVYSWNRVADSDITRAIQQAEAAQETANSKRKVFVVTPTTPYQVGDLWINAEELYTCTVSRETGDFVTTDFGKCVKYTDDTKANNVADNLSQNYSTTTQMNSAIVQKANEVLTTVSSTYVNNTTLNNYPTTTVMNTAIDQKASEITSTASASYATKSSAVSGVSIEYYLSTSQTEMAGGIWTTTPPTWVNGKYMWSRQTSTLADGTSSTTTPVCIAGAKGDTGETGSTGKAGTNGTDGRGISSTVVTYQASDSGTVTPTGTWSVGIPTVFVTQYLWTRTIITYTDGTNTTSYAIGRMGADGKNGDPGKDGTNGKGISDTSITYQTSTSNSTIPTGTWSTTFPTITDGVYLWIKTVLTYTDSTSTTTYSISKVGTDGAKGDVGDTGNGISTIVSYYLASANSAGITVDSTGWTTNIQTISYQIKYLWCYQKITYTSGNITKTTPIIIGAYGDTGLTGVGVSGVTPQYYLSTSATSAIGGTWQTTQPLITTGTYIWTRSKVDYDNGTTTYTDAIIDTSLNKLYEVTSELKQTTSDISATVQDNTNNISKLTVNLEGITSTVSDMNTILEDAADNIMVRIESSSGAVLKGSSTTVLSVHLYKNGKEVDINEDSCLWYWEVLDDTNTWNSIGSLTKSITVTDTLTTRQDKKIRAHYVVPYPGTTTYPGTGIFPCVGI